MSRSLRMHIVHDPLADRYRPGGNVLQSRQHSQQCRFAAPGRADQDDELPVLDRDRNPVQNLEAGKRFTCVIRICTDAMQSLLIELSGYSENYPRFCSFVVSGFVRGPYGAETRLQKVSVMHRAPSAPIR